ncbi:MAG: hypothetical protein RLZZ514_651 [Actinomycetota bacterium]
MKTAKVVRALTVAALLAMSLTANPVRSVADTGSAVTKTWLSESRDQQSPFYAEFKDFRVSVSQTQNLTNQGVTVSWSGLGRTRPGEFASNFVQIMQCWGDESGPKPEQCQWGAPIPATEALMGSFAANRDLMRGEDPSQAYSANYLIPPPVNQPFLKSYRVPFKSVKAEQTFSFTRFFSSDSSNEFSAAPTGVTGSGQAVFEVQTALEAPHLGCGAATASGPRSCWLVIVPRGETRADGTKIIEGERLGGSPLSASYWQNRIQIPMGFSALTVNCALGNSERRVVGSEMISAAFTSWQPAMCKNLATFGYSQIGDGEARRQITGTTSGSSGLAFISDPIEPELVGDSQLLYAPIANSAVVVAFNIEKNYRSDSPLASQNGALVSELKLNARLIAKLLTQSYRADVPGGNIQEHVKDNPRSIVTDPEFIALNPDFAFFQRGLEPGGLMVALGGSDATALVWRWLQNDAQANAFLKGEPDQWGMVLNKYYRSLELATDLDIESFPKADLSTYRANELTPPPGFSTLDLRPYTHDMLDAALASRRGDSKSKTIWDTSKLPAAFVSGGAQAIGQRFMIAITDLPAAKRYGLGVASLVSSDGAVSNPTMQSLNQAITMMPVDKESGMRFNDGKSITGSAYPWTLMTYAVVNTCTQTKPALADYSDMLTYATTQGQVPGEAQGFLPAGYVPLGENDLAKTKAVANALKSEGVSSKCPSAKPQPAPTPSPEPTDSMIEPTQPEPPTQPNQTIYADSFKTYPDSQTMTGFALLLAFILAVPGLITGRLLLASVKRRRENDSVNS